MENKDMEVEQGMIKKFQKQIVLEFDNLSYTIPSKKRNEPEKKILKSTCGKFIPGKLTAILGPSGAGKSSLLNVLSGIRTLGVTGKIAANGKPVHWKKFRRQFSYIAQEFALLTLLTTKETLAIAADFKLGFQMNIQKKNKLITEIIDLLGLLEASDVQVNRLSGGERKRLSIALELLTNPPVMFFDEPTSGLDIASSIQVINHLKNLALEGRTIVCVIHQPNSILFETFDDVIVICEGSILYGGPRANMIATFAKFGLECPQYYNPADFAIHIASKRTSAPLEQIADYHHSNFVPEKTLSQNNHIEKEDTNISSLHKSEPDYMIPVIAQICILLRRSYFCGFRDQYLTHLRIISSVCCGILTGGLYYNIGNDAEKVSSNIPCLFFIIFHFYSMNCCLSILCFPSEANVVVREHLNNWYSLKAYFISKLLSDIPLLFICPTLFFVSAYFLSGQPANFECILKFWTISILIILLSQTKGYAIGTMCKAQSGMYVMALIGTTAVLFTGFMIRFHDIPQCLQWITYLSFFRYAFEGAILSIYGNNRESLECSKPYCYFMSPRKIIQELHMENSHYSLDIIGLVIWIIFSQVIFYAAIRWKLRLSR